MTKLDITPTITQNLMNNIRFYKFRQMIKSNLHPSQIMNVHKHDVIHFSENNQKVRNAMNIIRFIEAIAF